jgi:hypothetical protein
VCGSTDNCKRVRIDVKGMPGHHADLCTTHLKPIMAVVTKLDQVRKPRLHVLDMPVMSEDEVAALAEAEKKSRAASKGHATRRAAD